MTGANWKSTPAISFRSPSNPWKTVLATPSLSRDRAKRLAAWLDLEAAMERRPHRQRHVNGKVKGGLTVMINGIRAFLPGSLVDMRPVKDTTPFEGKTMEFKVIKLDRKRNNVVVSRRAVLEASHGRRSRRRCWTT